MKQKYFVLLIWLFNFYTLILSAGKERVSRAFIRNQRDADMDESNNLEHQGNSSRHRTRQAISRHNLLESLKRPVLKHPNMDDMPVNVMISLIPIKIQDLIEKKEVLETTIRLQLSWRDRRMEWNPASYSNITEVVVPAEKLWAPDIAILNSVADVYDVVQDRRFEMKVDNTGRVWWHPTGIVKTYCKLYLRLFPLVFESPTLDLRFMNLTIRPGNHTVDTRMYVSGEAWQALAWSGSNLINKVGSKTYFARVEFYIHLKRANAYHVLNVILPAFFLSIVQVLFFLVPVTHPQRVGSSTTTLLSVVVFQTVAIAHLPKTSSDVPLLTIYIFTVVIVSAISVSTSIIVAKFAVFAEQNLPLPSWLARMPDSKSCIGAWLCWWKKKSIDKENTNFGLNYDFILIDSPKTPADQGTFNPSPHTKMPCSLCSKTARRQQRHAENRQSARLHGKNTMLWSNSDLFRHATSNTNHCNSPPSRTRPGLGNTLTSQKQRLFIQSWPMPAEPIVKVVDRSLRQNRLFQNWNDFSNFIDKWLMIIAVAIAAVSPVVLFIIVPNVAI